MPSISLFTRKIFPTKGHGYGSLQTFNTTKCRQHPPMHMSNRSPQVNANIPAHLFPLQLHIIVVSTRRLQPLPRHPLVHCLPLRMIANLLVHPILVLHPHLQLHHTPHTHPRASEINFSLNTTLQAGFLLENGARFVSVELAAGSATVFPQGSIHFELNPTCEPAMFVAAFNNEDPGVQQVAQRCK